MVTAKQYFLGKLIIYNQDGVIKTVEDIMTLAGGPEKESVKQLTMDTFLKFFPDFKETVSIKDFTGDKLDIKPHGYLLRVETVLTTSEEPVLELV